MLPGNGGLLASHYDETVTSTKLASGRQSR